MSDINWTPTTMRLNALELWEHNPKRISKRRADRLLAGWEQLGQFQTLAVGPHGECYDGHQRIKTLSQAGFPGDYEVQVLQAALAEWPEDWFDDLGLDDDLLGDWDAQAESLRLVLDAQDGVPDFDPVDGSEQPRLDQKSPIICPHCGEEFIPE